jgi:hypothetical protein
MKKQEVFKDDLEKLRQEVKGTRGSLTQIAKEADVSITFVQWVLSGERWSQKVVDAAAIVLPRIKQERAAKVAIEHNEIKSKFQQALA